MHDKTFIITHSKVFLLHISKVFLLDISYSNFEKATTCVFISQTLITCVYVNHIKHVTSFNYKHQPSIGTIMCGFMLIEVNSFN